VHSFLTPLHITLRFVTESSFDKSETAEENRIARKPEHNPLGVLVDFDSHKFKKSLWLGKAQEVSWKTAHGLCYT